MLASSSSLHTLRKTAFQQCLAHSSLKSRARTWVVSVSSRCSCSSSNAANRSSHIVSASLTGGSAGSQDEDEEIEDERASSSKGGEKPLRVERLLANLGYGRRKECTVMIKRRQLVYADTGQPAKVGEKALAGQLLLNGEPLDPAPPLTLLLHKPVGYVVTSPEDETVSDLKIYDLLPYRFGRRRPFLSAIGRLDKETSGLLLMTDDGQLLHSIQSPVKGIWKRYTAKLAAPLTGKEAQKAIQRFASGQMQLQGDRTSLLPAALTMLDDTTAEVAICEGRYHQIRRMFAALGHSVVQLHRHAIGGLSLADEAELPGGTWRLATQADITAVLSGPDSPEAAAAMQQQNHTAATDHQAGASTGAEQQGRHLEQSTLSSSGSRSQLDLAAASSSSADEQQHVRMPGLATSDGAAPSTSSACEVATAAEPERPDGSRLGTAEQGLEVELEGEEDLDHLGEEAAASKRFRENSKWARRRAAVAKSIKGVRRQQRRQQQQQESSSV